jgi:hypothetical protein
MDGRLVAYIDAPRWVLLDISPLHDEPQRVAGLEPRSGRPDLDVGRDGLDRSELLLAVVATVWL